MRIKTNILFLIIVVFSLISSEKTYAQKFTKHEIKTAFVHNFVRFVSWSTEKKSITIGIVGKDEFTTVLKAKLSNQKIGNLPIKVIHYTADQDFSNCEVLIVGSTNEIDCKVILNKIKGKTILSIGENENFCQYGGIINFVEGDNGNYFFEINQTRAVQEKIQISSKLLTLAIKIR